MKNYKIESEIILIKVAQLKIELIFYEIECIFLFLLSSNSLENAKSISVLGNFTKIDPLNSLVREIKFLRKLIPLKIVKVCLYFYLISMTGLKKGDRVALYMPMIIELVIAMLACARIGLIHSIVVSLFFKFQFSVNINGYFLQYIDLTYSMFF